jgi:hypothetical protein
MAEASDRPGLDFLRLAGLSSTSSKALIEYCDDDKTILNIFRDYYYTVVIAIAQ